MSKITAPFSESQVDALNAWQRWGSTPAFACPAHGAKLEARADGWHCPTEGCRHAQDWAHDFMDKAKFCTKDAPRDAATAQPSEYWIHVDAAETDPDYDGGRVPFHCPNCGLDFTVEI